MDLGGPTVGGPTRRASHLRIRFNRDFRAKFEVGQPISRCLITFLLLIPYFCCELDL